MQGKQWIRNSYWQGVLMQNSPRCALLKEKKYFILPLTTQFLCLIKDIILQGIWKLDYSKVFLQPWHALHFYTDRTIY